MGRAPSGEQYHISYGDQQATVVEVGGGVREYLHGGVAVLESYAEGAMCDGAHGTPLIPWPNRLADGRYSWDGAEYRVDLTEPAKANAIHGFLRWRPWHCLSAEPDRVTLGATIFPMSSYPFLVDVTVEYALGPDGLRVTTTAVNGGERAAPFASGQHPYLDAGTGLVDGCELELAAATRIVTDDARQLPVSVAPVAGTPFDFRQRRPIGELHVDYAFTDLARDAADRAWVRLWSPDGVGRGLWVDATYPYLEIYTGDTLSVPRRRHGLGVEPMTAPPNAFQTGQHVLRLEPGASATSVWGACLLP